MWNTLNGKKQSRKRVSFLLGSILEVGSPQPIPTWSIPSIVKLRAWQQRSRESFPASPLYVTGQISVRDPEDSWWTYKGGDAHSRDWVILTVMDSRGNVPDQESWERLRVKTKEGLSWQGPSWDRRHNDFRAVNFSTIPEPHNQIQDMPMATRGFSGQNNGLTQAGRPHIAQKTCIARDLHAWATVYLSPRDEIPPLSTTFLENNKTEEAEGEIWKTKSFPKQTFT